VWTQNVLLFQIPGRFGAGMSDFKVQPTQEACKPFHTFEPSCMAKHVATGGVQKNIYIGLGRASLMPATCSNRTMFDVFHPLYHAACMVCRWRHTVMRKKGNANRPSVPSTAGMAKLLFQPSSLGPSTR